MEGEAASVALAKNSMYGRGWYTQGVKQRPQTEPAPDTSFYVYILECNDGSLYTGMTNDLAARFKTHQEGKGGRYTRSRGVKRMAYSESGLTRSEALKREAAIKQLSKVKKKELCASS
jgi:putative endonuclease